MNPLSYLQQGQTEAEALGSFENKSSIKNDFKKGWVNNIYGDFVKPEKENNVLKDEYYEEGDLDYKTYSEEPESKKDILINDYFKNNSFNLKKGAIDKNGDTDIDKISNISDKDKKELKSLLNELENGNQKSKISNFAQIIDQIEEFKDIDKTMYSPSTRFEEPILNIIGEEYIEIPGSKRTPEENISLAIKLKRNSIETEVKNLKTNTQTYKTAIKNIESGNLKKQIEGINSLHALAYSGEGKYGKKKLDKYKEKRKKELVKEHNKLMSEYEKAKQNNPKKIDKIIEKDLIIKNEYEEIEDGEIFEGSDFDKTKDNIEKEVQD